MALNIGKVCYYLLGHCSLDHSDFCFQTHTHTLTHTQTDTITIQTHIHNPICIYTMLVCLSVRLYPINVKTAEPIRPKIFCAPRQGIGL